MPFVGDEIAVKQTSDETWQLLEDLRYDGNEDRFTVPAGFETDFASVPRPLWWLIPPYGRYTRSAILHDYLWDRAREGEFSRVDADGIFRRSMRELGVGFLRRWVMWAAVRVASGWSSFWAADAKTILQALVLATLAGVFLLVPAAVVVAWLAVAWMLEWLLYPILAVTVEDEQVNPPRLGPG